MQYGIYVGPTPITEYGCTLCQRHHRRGIDAEYDDHLMFQSKHGVRQRAPIGKAEELAAHVQAEERAGGAGAGK